MSEQDGEPAGGGDPDAAEEQGLENPGSDEVDIGRDAGEDEDDGTGDGEADAPVGVDLKLNTNDSDPTAGGSDVGGLAGGSDDD